MNDDLLTVKIARGFDQLDVDGDGRLTEYDHVLMGRRSARSLGHEEGPTPSGPSSTRTSGSGATSTSRSRAAPTP